MQAATIAGTMWMVLTALVHFILPQNDGFVLSMVLGVILLILPILNHVRIFIVIRRHNNEVRDAVSGHNLSAIFTREKKVAIDMLIVIAVLMIFLTPGLVVNMLAGLLGDKFEFWFVWTTSLIYVNSSVNPLIYWARYTEIRNAVKCMIFDS